ncbi:MAG: hypothetical protein J7L39_02345, partial [Candidatus Aenigmarchaeota archaeon]|nr:hypothetical protein [Candidatus Aenigmarchaeota archaeon]
MLKRINESFSKYLPDLTEVVNEISKDDFILIPADSDSKCIFEGMYLYLKEWKDPSKAEEVFRKAKDNWKNLKNRINNLSKEIKDFEKLTDDCIHLTHCLEEDKIRIINIEKILDSYQNKISPYTKFLLSNFIEKLLELIEPKLDEIEKRFSVIKEDLENRIKEYKTILGNIQNFENDTFIWINKGRKEIEEEIISNFKSVCQEFTRGGKIDLENVSVSYTKFI